MLKTFDFTWNATNVSFWSSMEGSLACIIACLPPLNHIIVKHIRKYLELDMIDTPKTLSHRLGVIRLTPRKSDMKRVSHVFTGHGKFVKYRADVTIQEPNTANSETQLQWEVENSMDTIRTESSERILVARDFYIVEERTLDLEHEEEEREAAKRASQINDITRPSRAYILGSGTRSSTELDDSNAATKV
ncbi:hypothetical protein ABW20_dc0103407 [Dactylellina cionopaga]|nr:hypothetical protein ABW20_dc0103407 [Dactylellina cionopaga]